ncbi:MAG: tetratricopeptide repeat protein [Candidatus Omnitrophota bacterium]
MIHFRPRAVMLGLSLSFLFSAQVLSAPFSREQLFQLATIAAGDHQFDRAIELFQKIIEKEPKFAPAYNGIGLVQQSDENGSPAEALRYFRLAVDIDPQYVEGWNNVGRAFYAQGHFVEAEQAFLTSLRLKPGQTDIEFALAWDYLLGQSRPDEAMTYFDRVIATQDNPMIYYGMGLAYLLKGNRFKVMDSVTQLRHHQREEQAVRLETMLRENVLINSKPGSPLVTGTKAEESLFDHQLEASGYTGQGKEGIKVRLKGPLL